MCDSIRSTSEFKTGRVNAPGERWRVGVVIPVLNEEDTIVDTLLAARDGLDNARDRVDADIVVVDGGSRDQTVRRARPHAQVLRSARGRARQMRAGIRALSEDDAQAGADVQVWVLPHADCRLPADYFVVLAEALDRGAWWGFARVRLTSPAWWAKMVSVLMNIRSRYTGIATGDQCLFVHRSLERAIGGIPRLDLMEDICLSSRLGLYYPPAVLSSTVRASSRRWHTNGVWLTILTMWCLRLLNAIGVDHRRLLRYYYKL